jgi:hypothetical protein
VQMALAKSFDFAWQYSGQLQVIRFALART